MAMGEVERYGSKVTHPVTPAQTRSKCYEVVMYMLYVKSNSYAKCILQTFFVLKHTKRAYTFWLMLLALSDCQSE